MNAPVSDFLADVLRARTGDDGPYSLFCAGETMTQEPDLGTYPVQVSVQIARLRRFAEALACAERRGCQRDLCLDAMGRFTPNLLTIVDRYQRLCLAGQIGAKGLIWCDPVTSDIEARGVVMEACRARSRAMAALDRGATQEARALRFEAAAIEARLVDPAWRLARPVRVTAQAA